MSRERKLIFRHRLIECAQLSDKEATEFVNNVADSWFARLLACSSMFSEWNREPSSSGKHTTNDDRNLQLATQNVYETFKHWAADLTGLTSLLDPEAANKGEPVYTAMVITISEELKL